jgi:hypothetical protein
MCLCAGRSRALLSAVLLSLTAGSATGGSFDRKIGELDEQLIFVVPRDAIPALTNPELLSAAAASLNSGEVGQAYLDDSDRVLGVEHNGMARAYPLNLGWWHEVINDRFNDDFISVTYCPLTGTGLVFAANDTAGDGNTQIELGVSGLLLNSNLVLYDRRDDRSLYPQMTYIGLVGDHRDESLQLLPVVETTWGLWQQMHPDTQVPRFGSGLSRYSDRVQGKYGDVDRFLESAGGYPYDTYRTDDDIYFPVTTSAPDLSAFSAKDVVLGICLDRAARAYPFGRMPHAAVINDRVASTDVVILFDERSRTAIPYERRVAGQLLRFYAVDIDGHVINDGLPFEFADMETGTRWNLLGQAVAGPLQGHRLTQVPAYNSMWFAWSAFWPESEVWDGTGIIEGVMTSVLDTDDPTGTPLALAASAPNPFNSTTRIGFDLPRAASVELVVYNSAGQLIRRLATGWQAAGRHQYSWDGKDGGGRIQASGTYLIQLRLPGTGQIRRQRMTLLR